MSTLDQSAIVLYTMESLRSEGSWCGETHVQKTMYLCQEMMRVPSHFKFILYKHGPYSFELSQNLQSLISDNIVQVLTKPPYGPTLDIAEDAKHIASEVKKCTVVARRIEFISRRLCKKNVGELERLATAVYINSKEGTSLSIEKRAEALVCIKPHVPLTAARQAFLEIEEIETEAFKAVMQ